VHDDVDSVGRCVDQITDLFFVIAVAGHVTCAQFLRQLAQRRATPRVQKQGVARGVQTPCARFAYAAGGTHDESGAGFIRNHY
jgi:inosine-uridine nucleoside N-ribohydrolase